MILLGVDPPAEPIQHGNNFSGGGQELVLGLPLVEAEVSAGQMDTVKENIQLYNTTSDTYSRRGHNCSPHHSFKRLTQSSPVCSRFLQPCHKASGTSCQREDHACISASTSPPVACSVFLTWQTCHEHT